jgi:NTP pyrophosphatase (non-canonical NTP hydrolase)
MRITCREAGRGGRAVTISGFQRQIEAIYFERDRERGLDADFRWFVEEVGELAKALRGGDRREVGNEFADVLAWLATMASIAGVELQEAVQKYARGCPKCGETPCTCPEGRARGPGAWGQ